MAEEQVRQAKAPEEKKRSHEGRRSSNHAKTSTDSRKPTIDPEIPAIDLTELKHIPITELHPKAEELDIELDGALRKQDMVFEIEDDHVEAPNMAVLTGKLQQVANGFMYHENETQIIHVEKPSKKCAPN